MIQGFACQSKSQTLEPFSYDPKPLRPFDIEVEITHCGICHSDLHLIDNDWGNATYPLIPGHEIVGIVKDKGTNIDHLSVGDRIGIGWQGSSCMKCEWCLGGEENLCSLQEPTCVGHYGGFAKTIRADGRFAFLIPGKLDSAHAAPLLCGGATTFSPFLQHKIEPEMKVGVVGIGGLGHLALQFAHAMGMEVTAFSSTPSKAEEAREFGAHHFIDINDQAAVTAAANQFDFILSSSISAPLCATFIPLLRPKGKLCILGGLEQELKLQVVSLVDGRKSICGSNIASRQVIKEMLAFSALHGIKPKVELFPMEDINKAIALLRKNMVRYRAVLVNA